MDLLDYEFLNNPVRSWVLALVTGGGVAVVLALLRRALVGRLASRVTLTRTYADDVLVELLRRTRRYFFVAVGVLVATRFLDLAPAARTWVSRGMVLLILFQIGRWVAHAIGIWVDRFAEQRTLSGDIGSITTVRALGIAARMLVWLLVVISALESVFDYDVTALITGLGIVGIAVALAVQNVLGDLIAALSIVLDKPFVVGDFIVVGDYLGTVEQIGLKTTRLRSLGGEQIIFSNAELLKASIRNYKRMFERRIVLGIEVHLDTPRETLSRLPAAFRAIIEAQSPVRFDRAHVAGITERSFRLEGVYYVLSPEFTTHMDVQQRILLAMLEELERENVRLARTLLEEKVVVP